MIAETPRTFTTALKTTAAMQTAIMTRGVGFLVACEGDEVLGFATYFPFRDGPGYAFTKEHSIVLHPRANGQGIGRRLMERLEAAARSEGVHSLIAGVSGENPDGVAFHAAIGFDEVARIPEVGRKYDRWMDLVIMQKIL